LDIKQYNHSIGYPQRIQGTNVKCQNPNAKWWYSADLVYEFKMKVLAGGTAEAMVRGYLP
jgi:hypothetical protein